jgi:hypothetical protein
LHIEMLTPEFGQKFWAFVRAGGYPSVDIIHGRLNVAWKIGVRSQLFCPVSMDTGQVQKALVRQSCRT